VGVTEERVVNTYKQDADSRLRSVPAPLTLVRATPHGTVAPSSIITAMAMVAGALHVMLPTITGT
jgi:hypothetical protein